MKICEKLHNFRTPNYNCQRTEMSTALLVCGTCRKWVKC